MRTRKSYIPAQHLPLLARLYSETGISVDRLPYTPPFDQLYAKFCAQSRLAVTPHELWEELIAMRKGKLLSTMKKTN